MLHTKLYNLLNPVANEKPSVEVVAEPEPLPPPPPLPLPPVAVATRPGTRAVPVAEFDVSLLSWPVGCNSSNGMEGRFVMYFRTMTGPMTRTMKTMSMKK